MPNHSEHKEILGIKVYTRKLPDIIKILSKLENFIKH